MAGSRHLPLVLLLVPLVTCPLLARPKASGGDAVQTGHALGATSVRRGPSVLESSRRHRDDGPAHEVLSLHRPLAPPRRTVSRQGTITGQVIEANTRQPLAGAQVSVPGTGLGALTNDAGRYLLTNVPVGEATVRVQMIGYTAVTQTVAVSEGGTATLDFELSETAISLDEVVVTGTPGGRERRAIGNVVARIDAAEIMDVAPVSDVGSLLTSRTPGVHIRPAGGVGTGARISIRGISSLTLDAQPLIYVDGVRVDNAVATGPGTQGGNVTSRLNDFNPDNIASIEIIKGPAAATLYGTEASGGVVQIITKQGRPGGDIDLGINIRQGANWFANPEEKFPTNWYSGPETNGELESLNVIVSENQRGTPVFRTGHIQGYGLTLRGGSGPWGVFLAGNVDREEGFLEPALARRYSGRANITANPHPTVTVTTSLGLNILRTGIARQESPTSSVYGAGVRGNPRYLGTPMRGWFSVPPEVIADVYDIRQEVDRFTGSVQISHRPSGWLAHRLTVGGDFVDENNEVLIPRLRPDLGQFFSPDFAQGSKEINQRNVTNTTVDYSATVTLPVSGAISSRTSVGMQYYREFAQFFSADGEQFPAPGVKTVGSAAIRFGSDDFVENVTVGTFVQEELAINDRLFVTGALRADDNSAFGRDFDIQLYPKISGSWVVSEEPFWGLDAIELLRLRAAYGASGQQPDAFAAIRTFAPITGTRDEPASTPRSLGNPTLGPERGEEFEAGFEAALLGGRLGLDFTFFNQYTRDAILLAPVAPSTGFPGSRFINAGEVQNRGLELLMTARPYEGQSASLDLTLNLSTLDSEILSLDGLGPIGTTGTAPGGPTAEHRVGYAPYSFFVKRVVQAELDAEGQAIDVLCDGGQENDHQPMPCDEAPRVYLGKLQPDVRGAVTSGLTLFDRLQVRAMFDFQLGRTNFAENDWARCSIYRICRENVAPHEFDARHIAEVERAGSAPIRSIYYKDASFTKLRELSATYTLPDSWTQGFGAESAAITIAGRNLYTWTEWPQFDPESTKLGLLGGFDQATAPPPSQFVTTLRMTF